MKIPGQLEDAQLENRTDDPSNLPDGRMWIRTDTDAIKVYDGAATRTLVSTDATQTLTNKTIDADGTGNSITNIENENIKASAAIDRSKLASGSNYRVVTNNGSGVMTDAAAITASRALVSDANGIPTHSSVTATELGYVSGVTSAIQTQLNSALTNPMTTAGDIIYGGADGAPTRLAKGTDGQALVAGSPPSYYAPTAGSVLFAGTSGALSQDNSNLFWDDTNNRFFIGYNVTQAPAASRLEVNATNNNNICASTFSTTAGTGAEIGLSRSKAAAPGTNTAVASGDMLGQISFYGADGTNYIPAARIYAEVSATPGTNDMPGRLVFATTSDGGSSTTERGRINNSGNFLWNTTTVRNNGRISVDYAGNTAGGMGINDTDSANGSALISFLTGGTFRASITNNNNTAVAYNTSSDYRLKENIRPMRNGLERILKLKPVKFDWKENGIESEGFIAHELQEYFPDAVTGNKDEVNEDGSIKPQGIDPRFLAAALVESIQGLHEEIKELKQKLKDKK